MNNFIPANSRIAVRNIKGGEPQWYTTKRQVNLPNELKNDQCPMREMEVLSFTHEGFELFFLPEQVQTELTKDEIETTSISLTKFDYDVRTGHNPAQGHPSQWLWRYAIRTTGSCWLIPTDRINSIMEYVHGLYEVGATCDFMKVDISESKRRLGQCVVALRLEIERRIAAAEESRQNALNTLNATPAEDDPNTAQKKYLSVVKQIDKKLQKSLDDLATVAGVFGINPKMNTAQLAVGVNSIEASRVSMKERARLFVEARQDLAAAGTADSAAAAASMAAGQMPPEIAADMIQENGNDALAETVRAAFIGEPETFNLTDAIDDNAA